MLNGDFLDFLDFVFFIKIGIIILVVFYTVFSIVILRRIQIMNRAIVQPGMPFVLMLIGVINIALSVLLFLLALVIL